MAREPFEIAGVRVAPGERAAVDLPVARLYTHTEMTMPVHVVHGRRPGPSLFVCAAIHGDEINGVEIIRRLLALPQLRRVRGTLIAVPIVNVYGFIQGTRYLPDRRDLNRSFPGSGRGSLTARLANVFLEEVVGRCSHGLDLHTGAVHRANLPQVRADLTQPDTERLARAFDVPVVLNSELRDGSLRQAAAELGIPLLVYEAGEALRFDEVSIRAGVRGVLGVMRALEMLPAGKHRKRPPQVTIARSNSWVRAPQSGILRTPIGLGARVRKGERLGIIADPFGEQEVAVTAPAGGIVIGRFNLPLVNEGDALFNIARYEQPGTVAERVAEFRDDHLGPDGGITDPALF